MYAGSFCEFIARAAHVAVIRIDLYAAFKLWLLIIMAMTLYQIYIFGVTMSPFVQAWHIFVHYFKGGGLMSVNDASSKTLMDVGSHTSQNRFNDDFIASLMSLLRTCVQVICGYQPRVPGGSMGAGTWASYIMHLL